MTAQASSEDRGRSGVVIVEDEPLVAETMREDLIDAGFDVVGLADRLEKAMKLVSDVEFDVAIVDVNLAGRSAAPLVERLVQIGRPFVVLSGYSREQLPESFSSGVFLRKPYQIDQLIAQVRNLATARRGALSRSSDTDRSD